MNKKGSFGDDNYTVGRERPPLLTRWKPGKSGNPRGRPKGGKNIMTYFLQALSKKITIKEGREIRKVTAREAIAMTITNSSSQG